MTDEKWLPVPGYEGKYEISNYGRVKSLSRKLHNRTTKTIIMRPHVCQDGRKTVALSKDGRYLHIAIARLVAWAFIGPQQDGLFVCHNNGNPSDDRPENLRYDTPAGNGLDKQIHGTQRRGETISWAVITESDIPKIFELSYQMNYAQIGRMYNVTASNIQRILRRETWKHVEVSIPAHQSLYPNSKAFAAPRDQLKACFNMMRGMSEVTV